MSSEASCGLQLKGLQFLCLTVYFDIGGCCRFVFCFVNLCFSLIHEVTDSGFQSLCENWRSSDAYSCSGNPFELKELKHRLLNWVGVKKNISRIATVRETGTTAGLEGCPALSLGVSLFKWGYAKQSVPKWKKENYFKSYVLMSYLNYFLFELLFCLFVWPLKIFKLIFWTLIKTRDCIWLRSISSLLLENSGERIYWILLSRCLGFFCFNPGIWDPEGTNFQKKKGEGKHSVQYT